MVELVDDMLVVYVDEGRWRKNQAGTKWMEEELKYSKGLDRKRLESILS